MRGKTTAVLLKDSPSNEIAKRFSYEKPSTTFLTSYDPKNGDRTGSEAAVSNTGFLGYLPGPVTVRPDFLVITVT